MLRELWMAIGLGMLLVRASLLSAQAPEKAKIPDLEWEKNSAVLYDAKTIGFDKDGKHYLFEGDVVLIGGAYTITADIVNVAYFEKSLKAQGHVLLVHDNQIFTGDSVELQWETGDFLIRKATLVANDPEEIKRVTQQILGQSVDELQYESARRLRLESLKQQKADLRETFRRMPAAEPSPDLVGQYAHILEQEQLTREVKPPNQAQRDPEKRKRFERRRIYWEKSRAEASKQTLPKDFYVKIEGETLERRDGFVYKADEASFTPCHCDADEIPPWGFQAAEITAMQEGYIDLKHPVLMIKGLPVLYLPFLKLPLKNRRQSGFLMPSFQTGEQKNGFVYTQPVFFDLAPNADATVTSDIFEKRGSRVGLELRYEARQHSGFRMSSELIRDRSWLALGRQREELLQYHIVDRPYCTQTDTVAKQICEQQVTDNLQPADNTWRGMHKWDGNYFFAPRLSLVSKGVILSDHRYVEDLDLPENYVSAFANQANAMAFSRAAARINFDGEDLFVGMGSFRYDNMLDTERYAGQQVPFDFKLQTRYFRLLPAGWLPVPIYAEFEARSRWIDEKEIRSSTRNPVINPSLGDGLWQRYAVQVTTPLSTKGIIQLDHFAEAELRTIRPTALTEAQGTIRSWKTGLSLNVPLDGTGSLPELMQTEHSEQKTFVRHRMNWGLSLSTRPVVIRDGSYGEIKDKNGAALVYFPSERKSFSNEDRDIPDEDMMVAHQRLTISTSHRWEVFDRGWEPIEPGPNKKQNQADELEDIQQRARRELREMRSLPPILEGSDTSSLAGSYRAIELNRTEPVSFDARMSFDFMQERYRREQIARNQGLEEEAESTADPDLAQAIRNKKLSYFALPESWLGPYATLGLNWRGVSLSSQVTYNLYKKTSTSLSFGLGLPAFYTTQVGATYVLEKSPELDATSGTLLFKRTKTSTFNLNTALIPYVTAGVSFIHKQVEQEQVQYGSSFQVGYDGLSGCWGVRLIREKDLNQNEEDANYILQLAIIFLGNRRAGDISPGIERELGVGSGRKS